jgi:chromosome segregation ATPase
MNQFLSKSSKKKLAFFFIVFSVQAQQIPPANSNAPVQNLNDIKSQIDKAERDANATEQAALAKRDQLKKTIADLRAKPTLTPEERARLRAAKAELRAKNNAEKSDQVRSERRKHEQAKQEHIRALNAAKEAHAKADAALQQSVKIKSDLANLQKPSPERGAHFHPQNVGPLLQQIDALTRRLAANQQLNRMISSGAWAQIMQTNGMGDLMEAPPSIKP